MDIIFLTSVIGADSTVSTPCYRPLGVYQLAWHLRQYDYQVQVADFLILLEEEQIIKIINNLVTSETKIIGLGLMVDFFNPSRKSQIKKFENVMFTIKKLYPNITLVVGSPAAHYFSRQHKNRELFDYVFLGHAEDGILALAEHLFRKGPVPQFEISDGNRIIRENFPVIVPEKFNIESCAHKWHDSDRIQPGETLPLELGRGCIFKCKFCQYPHIGKHKKDFNRDMECVKEELIDNYNRWGVTNYYMLDDTFNADQERIKIFADMVSTLPFKINYVTYLRIDLLHAHPESSDILYESGLKGAFLGIETLNPQAGALIDKPWGSKHAKTFLPKLYHDIWNKNVSVRTGWIAGIPPQRYEDLVETNKWLVDADLPSWWWFALFLNKDSFSQYRSEFDKHAEEYGFKWKIFDGRTYWKTDYCDALKAREWQIQLTNESKEYQKVACWNLFELANYGVDINVAMHTKISEFDWVSVIARKKLFLDNYFKGFFKQI
jgi:radical SAM superfamily enzyme YgiQ (UPF0313 family)